MTSTLEAIRNRESERDAISTEADATAWKNLVLAVADNRDDADPDGAVEEMQRLGRSTVDLDADVAAVLRRREVVATAESLPAAEAAEAAARDAIRDAKAKLAEAQLKIQKANTDLQDARVQTERVRSVTSELESLAVGPIRDEIEMLRELLRDLEHADPRTAEARTRLNLAPAKIEARLRALHVALRDRSEYPEPPTDHFDINQVLDGVFR